MNKKLDVITELSGRLGDSGLYRVGDIGIIATRLDGAVFYHFKDPNRAFRRIGYSVINREKLIRNLETGEVPEGGFNELFALGKEESHNGENDISEELLK